MNKQEAAKLLSLIKLSYPNAYRDIDRETAAATVNMWAMSFPDVPYPLLEQAFNGYRMTRKFPPTVAEMVEQLAKLHAQAVECANIQKSLGNERLLGHYLAILSWTDRYSCPEKLEQLPLGQLGNGKLEGGNCQLQITNEN